MQQFIQGTTKEDEINYKTKKYSSKTSKSAWPYQGAHGFYETQDERGSFIYRGSQISNEKEGQIMAITYRGETFEGYNKPKRTSKHPRSSHAVLAKEGDKIKLIRFGQQGVRGAGANPKTEEGKDRTADAAIYSRYNKRR